MRKETCVIFVNKLNEMKTLMMTLGLLTMAVTTMAQDGKMVGTEDGGRGGVYRNSVRSGEFYGKVVSYVQANNEIVRFEADDMMNRMTRDQDFLKSLVELRKYRFDSAIQALNILASHGWEVRSSMVVRGRNGDEQHYVLARPVDLMMPVSPWLQVGPGTKSRQK